MPPADDDAPIFLIGFMASGKTTVGRLLAERLDWAFVDLDKVIEEGAGTTVARIFAGEGEAGFRKRETAALGEVARRTRTVVATGGGAPCREENISTMLGAGRVFWLDVTPEAAVERAGKASGRPLLDGAADPVGAARKLLKARAPFYARAHARIETDDRSAEEVVTGLLKASLMMAVREDILE
jgi:shikimate kinase